MPFPLPTPDQILTELEGDMEQSLRAYVEANDLTVSPEAIARAVRSPVGIVSALIRATTQALYTNHLHLRWWGDQYMPDTAEVENLIRHASIWGIFRRPATKALGFVAFAGTPGTVIPLDLELRSSTGAIYRTTASSIIPAGGSVTVAVLAAEAGADANAAAATILSLVSPLIGLTQQNGIVDAGGLAGGAAEESDPDLLDRVLERIRQPAHGGAAFDYPVWVQNVFAVAHVRTLSNWVGRGTVGVCVAMGTKADPLVPTQAQLDAIGAYIGELNSQSGQKPVTAEVVMVPVELLDVPLRIALDPNQVAVQQAVAAAHRSFYIRDARIGDTIFRSRLSEAISSASGEYRHELVLPAANVVATARQLPVPGPITFEALP